MKRKSAALAFFFLFCWTNTIPPQPLWGLLIKGKSEEHFHVMPSIEQSAVSCNVFNWKRTLTKYDCSNTGVVVQPFWKCVLVLHLTNDCELSCPSVSLYSFVAVTVTTRFIYFGFDLKKENDFSLRKKKISIPCVSPPCPFPFYYFSFYLICLCWSYYTCNCT